MSATLTPSSPAKAHPARQQAIRPYLDKLEGWCNSPAGSQDLDRAARIHIGRQQLVVEPWERAQLVQYFSGTQDGIPALLAHGVALVIKSTLDVERLKKAESNTSVEIYGLQAELMLDTAIGMALLHETDLATTHEVQGGAVETAKSLSAFRHKLSRGVGEAKKRIADSERQQAEALAGSMTDRPFAAAGTESGAAVDVTATNPAVQTLIEEASALADQVPRRRRRRPKPRTATAAARPEPVRFPSRTRILAVAAVVMAVVWVATVQLPAFIWTDMVPIDASQLQVDADLTVEARPPSLFIRLPEDQWAALDESEQDALIDSIASVASREGYSGALVTTDIGRPVARWLRTRGAERVLDSEVPVGMP